jgi:hypothetical protein
VWPNTIRYYVLPPEFYNLDDDSSNGSSGSGGSSGGDGTALAAAD